MLISFHTKLFKFFWKEKSRISRLLLRRNSTRVLKEENKENKCTVQNKKNPNQYEKRVKCISSGFMLIIRDALIYSL